MKITMKLEQESHMLEAENAQLKARLDKTGTIARREGERRAEMKTSNSHAAAAGARVVTKITWGTKSQTVAGFIAAVIGLLATASSGRGALYYWYNIGPQPINTLGDKTNIVERDSGRVTALAVD